MNSQNFKSDEALKNSYERMNEEDKKKIKKAAK